jgi:hypothetical protein
MRRAYFARIVVWCRGGVMVSMSWIWRVLVVGVGLVLSAGGLLAQRGIGSGAPLTPTGAPSGVDEKDQLEGFHHAMAVQATSQQTEEFRALLKQTEAAARQFDNLAKNSDSQSSMKAEPLAEVRQALDSTRTATVKFVGGLSGAQKIGLKETTAKLMKAESDLGEQEKALEVTTGTQEGSTRFVGRTDALRKALADFRSELDSLAVEMGVVLSDTAEHVVVTIPARKSPMTIGGQTVGISTSAVITRPSAAGAEAVYKVEATSDLGELQENIGTILIRAMNREDRCGERIRLQEANLAPDIPAAEALVRLHYERWTCSPGYGGTREITEGNATVYMRLTSSVGANGQVQISTEIVRVEAERFLADLVKSGSLGDKLREQMSSAVTAGVANLKTMVPVVGDATVTRSVVFASSHAEELSVVVDGELRMSDEQVQFLREQLKQHEAAAAARKQ